MRLLFNLLVSFGALAIIKTWVDPDVGAAGLVAYAVAMAANVIGFGEGYVVRMRQDRA